MEVIKAMGFVALITGCATLVMGLQGWTGGQLAIHSIQLADIRFYWSWPMFTGGTGLFWGLLLLQR